MDDTTSPPPIEPDKAKRIAMVTALLDRSPMNRFIFFGQRPNRDDFIWVGMVRGSPVSIIFTGQVVFNHGVDQLAAVVRHKRGVLEATMERATAPREHRVDVKLGHY